MINQYPKSTNEQLNQMSVENVSPRHTWRRMGHTGIYTYNTRPAKANQSPAVRRESSAERLRLVKSADAFSLNKGDLIGNPNRRNEDTSFCAPYDGLFAVFDGMGGQADGAIASEMAAHVLNYLVNEHPIRSVGDLLSVTHEMSTAVRKNTHGGGTTAVIGQIVEINGKKQLYYINIGDSRIYHIRNGEATQITKDQGEKNRIRNYLGIPKGQEKPAQLGTISLKEGDYLLFCSDGITGDVEKDFIPNSEIAYIVEHSASTKEAAANLVYRATKKDDRTAIVVRI